LELLSAYADSLSPFGRIGVIESDMILFGSCHHDPMRDIQLVHDPHVYQCDRYESFAEINSDPLDRQLSVLHSQPTAQSAFPVLGNPEKGQSLIFRRKSVFPQPALPQIRVDHLPALRHHVNLMSVIQQRDTQTVRVCTSYPDHVALTPYLELQGAVQPKTRVEKLENHQHTSRTAGKFGALCVVGYFELHEMSSYRLRMMFLWTYVIICSYHS
jgi:hypothetical protein